MKKYPADFYDAHMQVAIVGYIRPMVKFNGIGASASFQPNCIDLFTKNNDFQELYTNVFATVD